jgi:uncharacterized membrane protein YcjF (UPF0283 family)
LPRLVWGTRGNNPKRAADAATDGEREPEKPTETTPENTAQPTRHNYNYSTKNRAKTSRKPDTASNQAKTKHAQKARKKNTLSLSSPLLSLFSLLFAIAVRGSRSTLSRLADTQDLAEKHNTEGESEAG